LEPGLQNGGDASSLRKTEMERSFTNFVGRIAGRCYSIGYVIPATIMCLLQLHVEVLSSETAGRMCGWLDFIWPTASLNFSKMVDIGFITEANNYVLLILISAVYAGVTFVIVLIRYFAAVKRIPQLDSRKDVVPWVVLAVICVAGPRLYLVREDFKRLSDFYIDQYSFWVFKNYIMLLALFVIPLFAIYAIKLMEPVFRKPAI